MPYRPFLAACALVLAQSAAAASLAPSQYNDGSAVDSEPVGTRIPLVLVHGLGGSGQGWENLLQAYARQPAWRAAFKPYTFRYDTSATQVAADPAAPRSIQALGAAFRTALEAYYDKPAAAPHHGFAGKSIAILAHSMGGLVARSMMQEHSFADGRRGGERVLHLVTLGTPHLGTPLADAAFAIGYQGSDEINDTYVGFLADMTWTNADRIDAGGLRCNAWLARLNAYAPRTAADLGRCGTHAASTLRGYYEKLIVYGARGLQSRELQIGTGVFEPGSDSSLLLPHWWLASALSRSYANDGLVPSMSALFEGAPVAAQREAHECDHRYLERGYPQVVRTWSATYSDWAFCAATGAGVTPSGQSGGWAVGGTIVQAIADVLVTASTAQRVFHWAEAAYAPFLQPAGALTDYRDGAYVREYPQSQSLAMIKDGNIYYRGPSTLQQLVFIAPLAQYLGNAQANGY